MSDHFSSSSTHSIVFSMENNIQNNDKVNALDSYFEEPEEIMDPLLLCRAELSC